MAGVEWGPKNVPLENRKLLEVTQFSGRLLQNIDARTTSYLNANPGTTRSEAVAQLTGKDKEARRMQSGLDILNQLSVVSRIAEDVRSVIVRRDINSGIYWYEIDWVNPPIEKPAATAQPATKARSGQSIYPFKTAEQRQTDRASRINEAREKRQRKRADQEAREREQERERAEREVINGVVIDAVRETTQQIMKDGFLKIELGEDDKAVILYREFGFGEYSVIDRENGTYNTHGDKSPLWKNSINPAYCRYFNILAQQAEGQKVEYTPEPHTPEVCQDTYERALKVGLLRVVQDEEKGTVFQYVRYAHTTLFTFLYGIYGEMDLERNVVIANTSLDPERIRPIHPDFAEFLRQKKVELDSQTQIG